MAPHRRLPAAALCAAMLLPTAACEAAPDGPGLALAAALTSARTTERPPGVVTGANAEQADRDATGADQPTRQDQTIAGDHRQTDDPTAKTAQHAPEGRPVGPATDATGARSLATRTALPTATPPPATAALLGAAPEILRRWLGDPSLRRPEGTAEIWLYLAPACALDIILYRTAAGLRVAHAAARANGADPPTEPACLNAIARTAATARQHS